MRGPASFRWLTFGFSTAVLVTGIVLLSGVAAGTGLAPLPGPDEGTGQRGPGAVPNSSDSPVVDRLNTWAETKGKKHISPGHPPKGNDEGHERFR